MSKVAKLSEEEFQKWLWEQLEKRKYMYDYRLQQKELQQLIYEILFLEQEMQVEEIERFFIPFNQAGYLSIRRKFELMLFVLEKEMQGSAMYFLEDNGYSTWKCSECTSNTQSDRGSFSLTGL